jgi:hypothetical protein
MNAEEFMHGFVREYKKLRNDPEGDYYGTSILASAGNREANIVVYDHNPSSLRKLRETLNEVAQDRTAEFSPLDFHRIIGKLKKKKELSIRRVEQSENIGTNRVSSQLLDRFTNQNRVNRSEAEVYRLPKNGEDLVFVVGHSENDHVSFVQTIGGYVNDPNIDFDSSDAYALLIKSRRAQKI